jgi:hypothetical protein
MGKKGKKEKREREGEGGGRMRREVRERRVLPPPLNHSQGSGGLTRRRGESILREIEELLSLENSERSG